MPQELTPELLLYAYRQGAFPMAADQHDDQLYWFDPEMRGILPLDRFRMSRSLARRIRTTTFQVTLNRAFDAVVAGCAARDKTWINTPIARLFGQLHGQGHAHSLEIWEGEKLAGGVYGLALGGLFCGESMFSRRVDASKIALAFLVVHLRRCGFSLFDTQYLTEHLASLGGVEIPRAQYHALLETALQQDADITRHPVPGVHEVLQLRTQRS